MTPPSPADLLRTMASEWADYAALALADDAPLTLRAQTKHGFYSGALCALAILADSVDGPPETMLPRFSKRLQALDREIITLLRVAADRRYTDDPENLT